ncbi:MAG: prepilin-type N-terminal cleavage/methylation domain-containing protein [Nitrospirae bacterium]|nr:prepilin-type N-terminal cleavage/methylation domain-containing protein [Nitrospirota bacterium]
MSKGYSLIELMITMAIFVFAVLTFSKFFISEHHLYAVQEADTEIQQTLRNVLNIVNRELIQTGYGLPAQINGITKFKKEELIFRANIRDIATSLVSDAVPEQNILNVMNSTGTTFKKDDVIVLCDKVNINRCEEHTLSENGTNNSVILSSPVNETFIAGSRINLINTISYRYNSSRKEFQRKIDKGTWESLAENIPADGLTFSYKDRSNNTPVNSSDIIRIDISLSVESFRKDMHLNENGGYWRRSAKTSVTLRNYL